MPIDPTWEETSDAPTWEETESQELVGVREAGPLLAPGGEVTRFARPGSLLADKLLPAIRKIGGEIIPGEKGDTHPDIIDRHGIGAFDIDQRGFLAPNGEFLDREAAAQGTLLPTEREPGRLHSTDLIKAEQKPVPPAFEEPMEITPSGPVYRSQIEEAKFGALRPPSETPLSRLTGLAPETLDRLRVSPVGRALFGTTEAERAAGVPAAAAPSLMETMPEIGYAIPTMGLGSAPARVRQLADLGQLGITTAFITDFIKESPEAFGQFVEAAKRKDWDEAKNIAVNYGFGAAFTAVMALGLHENMLDQALRQARARFQRPRPTVTIEPPGERVERPALPPAAEAPPIEPEVLPPEPTKPPALPPAPGEPTAPKPLPAPPAAPAAEVTAPKVEAPDAAVLSELNLKFDGVNAGAAIRLPTKEQLAAMPEALRQKYAEIEKAQGRQWAITPYPPSPIAGRTFYVPEGATADQIRAAHDRKLQEEQKAKAPPVAPPTPRLPGGLIEVPPGEKPLQAERQQIVRILQTLEEEDAKGRLWPKEGKEDTVEKLRARLAEIEAQLMRKPEPAAPTPVTPPVSPKGMPEDLAVVPELPNPDTLTLERVRNFHKQLTEREAAILDRYEAAGLELDKIRKQISAGVRNFTERQKLEDKDKELTAERVGLKKAHGEIQKPISQFAGTIGLARMRAEAAKLKGIPQPEGTQKITGKVLKAQKENLLQQVDAAIKAAPEDSTEKITISVPGDGDFTIANTKLTLKNFRELAEAQFPESVGGQKEPKLPSRKGKTIPKVSEPNPADLGEIVGPFVSTDPSRFSITSSYSDGTQIIGTDGRQLIRIVTDKAPGRPDAPVRLTPKGEIDKKAEGKYPNWKIVGDPNPPLLYGGMDTGQALHIVRQAQVFRDTSVSDKGRRPHYPMALFVNPDRSLGARMEILGDSFEHNLQPNALRLGTYNPDYLANALIAARRLGNERVDVYSHSGELGALGIVGKNHQSLTMPLRGESALAPDREAASKFLNVAGRAEHGLLPEGWGPLADPMAKITQYTELAGLGKFQTELEGDELRYSEIKTRDYDKSTYEEEVGTLKVSEFPEGEKSRRKILEGVAKAYLGEKSESIKGLSNALLRDTEKVLSERRELEEEVKDRARAMKEPAPAAPPTAPPTPTPAAPPTAPGAPILPKDRADGIRERLKKKLQKPPQETEEMALEDRGDEAELARQAEIERRLQAALKRATPEEIAIVQPMLDRMAEVKKQIAEIEARRAKRKSEAGLEARAPETVEELEALEARAKLDPSIFSDAVQLGAYYIQSGLHKFEPWAGQMRADFGEAIEPYLKSVYETARRTIEAPIGQSGGGAPGLQPGLLAPNARIVHARGDQTAKADESILPAETVKFLDPHQRQGAATNIKSMEERGGALNADGTGVGKTREGLTVAQHWAAKGFKVIYVTKAEAIKPDWKKKTFGGSLWTDSQAMGLKIKLARDAILAPGEIGVTTYENASAVEHRADLQTVIIWDESHALKNNSARGRAGDRANHKAKAVLFMSATPADKPEHIYYLQRIGIMEGKTVAEQLRDLGMVEIEVPYVDKKTGERKTHKVWAPNQNISEAERNARFSALFDRMTENGAMIKREISMQGVHVQVLKVALPPEAHDLQQDILRFFDAETVEDLVGIKKAIALMHMRRQQEPFKIASTVMLAQRELAAGRQVMIFVSRVNESEVGKWIKVMGPGGVTERVRETLMSSEGTAKALRNAFHEAGIHDIAEIHGAADQPGLEALADFNGGKKRVCIATIESGGTGINADDTVGNRPRTMVVVTAPFDAVGNVQAAGRIWRLKTLSGANIFYLFADTDVDDWNADIIGSKMATLGAVVEGQVRRLDITNPDFVTTDDFGAAVGKKKAAGPAPVGPSGMPKLDWQPYTTAKGEKIYSAVATGQFWQWYKTAGEKDKLRAMGGWAGMGKDRKLRVFSRTIPEQEAPPGPTPPPASDPTKGPGGETALEARHGTASGLPPGVPDGGPNYAAELMEASRRLGTVVRSRTTLPPGVMGRYVQWMAGVRQADKIEVGDIQNQATVAHEMGHDLDALLFPAIFSQDTHRHSQVSLPERVGLAATEKKTLFDELVKVSELMRGPIAGGSAGHLKYRKRATELIADFFSLYAHDPARARTMAPKWSTAFEAALRSNPDAAETIRQLLAGNVEPVAPTPTGAGAAPTGAPAGMPGAVPAREVAPTPREDAAAVAAEELVKGSIRRYESEVQAARIRAENWREEAPDSQDRNDVGAFVEGTGNLEIPGDTRDAVITRMTPEKQQLAKSYRFQIELQRQRINQYLSPMDQGEYLSFLQDYIAHFYVNSRSPAGREAVAKFIKNSPNAKLRKIPTLREAVEYGLIPITQDPTVTYELHARINWRVATNRMFLAQLKRVTTSAGEPVVVPASQNPGGWPVSQNPLIQRVYAHATPTGTMLWRGGAAIHPDIWQAVRQILEVPTRSRAGIWYDAVNAFTRANAFAFSLFHDITLRSASLGAEMQAANPLRGLFRLFEQDPVSGELKLFQSTRGAGKELLRDEEAVADAALHGLKFAWTESESYQHAARDTLENLAAWLREVPFLGKTAKVARDIQHWRQKGLWRNTHDAFKILAYHDLVNKALSGAPPGTDAKAVKQRIASLINDAFGGQEWQTKFWLSPQVRVYAARFWLAPDWTLSTLRSVPFLSDSASATRGQLARVTGRGAERTPKEGWRGNIGRGRFWGAELAALALATLAAQYAIFRLFGKREKGDKPWVWENEAGQNRRIDATPIMRMLPWHKADDPTRYYVNLGKRPEEILHWFVQPEMNVQAKLARPLIEAVRQLTGTEGDFKAEWKRDHESFMESLPARARSAGREIVPFVFEGNQFALSVPYRKGMTRYKAQQAFESAYELVAEPSRVRAALRGSFSGNIEKLLGEIRDAATRNGVNAAAVERLSRSAVRGEHYHKYFQAYQKGDKQAMDRETDALARLGATGQDLYLNIQRREHQLPGFTP